MKKYIVLLLLLILCVSPLSAQRLRREGSFQTTAMTPTALTGEKGHHNYYADIIEYADGSDSLNSAKVTENWNGIQITIRAWVYSHIVPGDGATHYILDNQGTGAAQDRVQLYIDTAGLLTFVVHDTDSTQHLVSYDVTGWRIHTWHQVVATLDFNANTIELYTDGASRDSTPDNALSSDSIGTTGSTTSVWNDNSDTNQWNGLGAIQVLNRVWSDAEVTSDYASAAGIAFVVDPDTILMGKYSDDDTGAVFWHRGCTVSAIVDNGSDATLTTPANSDNRFADGDAVVVSDGTGYSKQGFVDGAASDTAVTVDDGGGAGVGDIEKVGVFADLNGSSHYFYCADEAGLSLTGDFTIEAWIKTSARVVVAIATKWNYSSSKRSYALFLTDLGKLFLNISSDGITPESKTGTDVLNDGLWHHIACIYDATADTVDFRIDGVADSGGTQTYTAVTGALNDNNADFNIGAQDNGGASYFNGSIARVAVFNDKRADAEILASATDKNIDLTGEGNIIAQWDFNGASGDAAIDNAEGTAVRDLTPYDGGDVTFGNCGRTQEAYVSKNLLADGDMENGGIGAWTVVGTPTTVDKETDTDSDTKSLHILSAADDDGVSQTITASNGDKFYLCQRHKVTAGSFEVNVTNGGGGIETGINDASWTELEKIISATGNLTFQWLGEAAADDFNISKATIQQCVAGDALVAGTYYTLVNVDGGAVGAAWSGLGSDAAEVGSGDLYVVLDEADASTETKTPGFYPLRNPLRGP